MNQSLLDRLRRDLPADWQQAEAAKWGGAWYADPVRTVYLQIGDARLFVSARAKGAIAGPIGAGERSLSWRTLARSICDGAARLAIQHAQEGKPIPELPPWATPALRRAFAQRIDALAQREISYLSHVAAIKAERAILSKLFRETTP